MNRNIFILVRSLYILKLVLLSSRCQVALENTAIDPICNTSCNCCKNGKCQTGIYNWPNVCTEGCIDRHRGARCYDLCTHNCVSCDNNVSTCDSCFEGFHPGPKYDCTSTCPRNCKNCTSGSYCTACKEGYYNRDGSTTCPYAHCPGNCECSGYNCTTCQNGFFDTSSECNQECPSNCLACSSVEKCNECVDGFYIGHEFDDNVRQLSNICTFKCRESCTECQSYGNCVNCLKGMYGTKCQSYCSIGCKDETCHIESGNCICLLNFVGDRCTDCVNGKYGTYCYEVCPEHCKEGRCNRTTGYCSEGCITDTVIGTSCDTCIVGMYGILCDKSCPTNCKAKTCNRTTGVCSEGCIGYFKGQLCDTCIEGKYGVACNKDCPLTCESTLCEKVTGKCLSCSGNFDGNICENCKPGFHGQTCNVICSSHCYNNTCGIDTGVCDYGCKDNFSGDMCCVPGVNCVKCASKTECKECDSRYFNNLCDKPCPVNCLHSCDISTGICHDCKINHFGSFCVRTCPENCKVSSSGDTRICTSFDGTCTFGCTDGFYGSTCYKSCSNLCIDNVCKQDSGICDKGCDGSNDDQVCVLGKPSPETSTARTTIIVLATFLALTTTALCTMFLWILVRKLRSKDRPTEASSFQIPLEHELVMNQSPQNEVSEEDNSAYEILNRSEGAIEHTYDTASVNAPKRMASPGNTEYINLQLPR